MAVGAERGKAAAVRGKAVHGVDGRGIQFVKALGRVHKGKYGTIGGGKGGDEEADGVFRPRLNAVGREAID